MRSSPLIVSALLWSASVCAAQQPAAAAAMSANVDALLHGRFDNREQVAQGPSDAEHAIPHVTVVIEPTPQRDWSLWHVHVDTGPDASYDQTWAMQTRVESDGITELIPYYQFKQTSMPAAATFDPQGWLSLEACALRGDFGKARIRAMSEGEQCVAVSMGVGARRALLPVGIEREAQWLHLDMDLRGARVRIDAKRS